MSEIQTRVLDLGQGRRSGVAEAVSSAVRDLAAGTRRHANAILMAALLLLPLAFTRRLLPPLLALRLSRNVNTTIFLFAIGLGAGVMLLRGFMRVRARPFHYASVAFLVGLVVWLAALSWSGVVIRPEHEATVRSGLIPCCWIVLAVVIGWRVLPGRDVTRGLFVLATLIVAITVLLDAYGWWPLKTRNRPSGLLLNRNFAGEYLALGTSIAVVVLDRGYKRVLLVLLGVALVLTRSRTAWLVTIVATVTLVVLARADLRSHRAKTLAWLLGGTLLGALVPSRLQWKDTSPYASTLARLLDFENGSGALRLEQYRETLKLMHGHWGFGLGPGQWQGAMQVQRPPLALNYVPHSDYLRVLSESGIVGLVGLSLALAAVSLGAWRARRVLPEGVAFVFGLIVMSSAGFPIYRADSALFAFMLMGIVLRENESSATK